MSDHPVIEVLAWSVSDPAGQIRASTRILLLAQSINHGLRIIVRGASPKIELGDVAEWGTTILDLQIVENIFPKPNTDTK